MAKISAWRGRDQAGDQRAALRAGHQRVDVAVDDHVDGVGAAGGQRAADQRDAAPATRQASRPRPGPWSGTVVISSSSMIRGLVSAT